MRQLWNIFKIEKYQSVINSRKTGFVYLAHLYSERQMNTPSSHLFKTVLSVWPSDVTSIQMQQRRYIVHIVSFLFGMSTIYRHWNLLKLCAFSLKAKQLIESINLVAGNDVFNHVFFLLISCLSALARTWHILLVRVVRMGILVLFLFLKENSPFYHCILFVG